MAGRSEQHPTQPRRGRSTPLSSPQLARELLRRRKQHERAIAELDELLSTLDGGRPAAALPASLGRAGQHVGKRRVYHVRRSPREAAASLHKIVAAVSEVYGVTAAEMRSPSRTARIMRPRLVAVFLAYELARCSQVQIGSYFGGRDQTTVIHALRRAEQERRIDPRIDRLMAELRS